MAFGATACCDSSPCCSYSSSRCNLSIYQSCRSCCNRNIDLLALELALEVEHQASRYLVRDAIETFAESTRKSPMTMLVLSSDFPLVSLIEMICFLRPEVLLIAGLATAKDKVHHGVIRFKNALGFVSEWARRTASWPWVFLSGPGEPEQGRAVGGPRLNKWRFVER